MKQPSVYASLVVLIALISKGSTQSTNATCLTGFEWMTNSRGQSPCLVAAYLIAPSLDDPTHAHVSALPPDFHYLTPSKDSPCLCNSVYYSMLQACAVCQDRTSDVWSTWIMNCSNVYQTVYPCDFSSGTAVPAWGYLNVTHEDNFDATAAKALADTNPPESTANSDPSATKTSITGSPTSTGSSSPSPSTPLSPTLQTGGHDSSKAGDIAAGVIGGLAGLTIVIVCFRYYRNRQNVKSHSGSYGRIPWDGAKDELLFNQEQGMTSFALRGRSMLPPNAPSDPAHPSTGLSIPLDLDNKSDSGSDTTHRANSGREPPRPPSPGWSISTGHGTLSS
ncbi:hypothetical protein QCA50_005997 [Cerrena zonata]|uniref:Uncharacterized protein n=1 Tax=Cerrena zonata TaxID=2478898 RepID=A0AAW0GNV5_9APHY